MDKSTRYCVELVGIFELNRYSGEELAQLYGCPAGASPEFGINSPYRTPREFRANPLFPGTSA